MAKQAASSDTPAQPVEQLNALIPADLKRRMKIASANAGKPMTTLLIEWIEIGLAKVEKTPRN